MYNKTWLLENINSGSNIEFVFFWGKEDRRNDKSINNCFSQWYMTEFIVDDVTYKSSEHWMMAKKALLFEDFDKFNEIIRVDRPKDAKRLGREIKHFDSVLWDLSKERIVFEGNMHKFSQDLTIKRHLLSTQSKILVETSPIDDVWGIGLDMRNPKRFNVSKWRGLNLLGFVLMAVRDNLRR